MYGSEVVVFLLSLAVAFATWLSWFIPAFSKLTRLPAARARTWLWAMPVCCASVLVLLLSQFAASDVRDSAPYMLMYSVMGAAWVGLGMFALRLAGLRVADETIGRRNHSVNWLAAGIMLGLALSYLGGNFGEGPGWSVVVFSSGLATTAFAAVLALINFISRTLDTILVERSAAAALRSGAFATCTGAICGRSVVGDWPGVAQTLLDFALLSTPLLVLVPFELLLSWLARPSVQRPHRSTLVWGVLPALIYLLLTSLYLLVMGGWI